MQNTPENKIILYLIRHGKTPMNELKKYVGWTDEDLSVKGRDEISNKVNDDYYPMIDMLYSSPMKRCIETGKIIYPDYKPFIIEDFREINFGEFEGKNYKELADNKNYQAWIDSGGKLPFPDGENLEAFIKRSVAGMDEMIDIIQNKINTMKNINIAAIVHGGTIMSVLSDKYGGDYYDYQIENGKGYKCLIDINENDWIIKCIEEM